MTLVSLVTGGSSADRERAIATAAPTNETCAAIIEGLPCGDSVLNALALQRPESMQVVRVAPGCPCCSGNLTVRVTLNRLLRRAPSRLYLSLSSSAHRNQILAFLQEPQYHERLTIGADIGCG
jgi:G3E family GTPase